ncbi:MAG: HD-GYP domain-containing protein [Phycisphaerales bacterium]|nr:HD-GYP domain-containing protein [Phycisphaerales bacterium]
MSSLPFPSWTGEDRRDRSRPTSPHTHHLDAVFTLARTSEIYDEDTGAHVLRIRHIVERLAIALGWNTDDAELLGCNAMLHDIGKLYVPPEILKKSAGLLPHERMIMQMHTERGARLLAGRESMEQAARIARSHHEWWNGEGYPDQLAGEAIPIEARITAVADVLDALMARRSYKEPWSFEKAYNEIRRLAGTQLDTNVVDALNRCNDDGSLSQLFGLSDRCALRDHA